MKMNYKSPHTKFVIFFLVLTVLLSSHSLYIRAINNIKVESKISPEIEQFYQNIDSTSEVEVGIWLEGIPKQVLHEATLTKMNISQEQYNKMLNSDLIESGMQEYTSIYRDLAKKYYTDSNTDFVHNNLSNAKIVRTSSFLPVIVVNMNYSQIAQIAQNNQIKKIVLSDTPCIGKEVCSPSSEYSLQSFDPSDLAHSVYTGEGVKIGIMDYEMPSPSTYNGYDFTLRYPTHSVYGDHFDAVTSDVLALAPDAEYFCTTIAKNSVYTSRFDDELDWLVDNDVHIITTSIPLTDAVNYATPTYSASYRYADIYVDALIYNYNVVITKSSGNGDPNDEFNPINTLSPGAMAYNAIVVAAYDDRTGDIGGAAWNVSGSYAAKPDFMAYSLNASSRATPIVCGIIAQMMHQRPSFRYIPEEIRSILAATVDMSITHHYVPMQPRTTNSVGYNKYGAGLVCAANVRDAVSNHNFSLYSVLATETYKTKNITITNTSKPIRIAISFLKGSNSLEDYDLTVKYGNSTVATSITTYNNVEIVEFTPSVAGTYTIYMTRMGAATEAETYIGVAWYQD